MNNLFEMNIKNEVNIDLIFLVYKYFYIQLFL